MDGTVRFLADAHAKKGIAPNDVEILETKPLFVTLVEASPAVVEAKVPLNGYLCRRLEENPGPPLYEFDKDTIALLNPFSHYDILNGEAGATNQAFGRPIVYFWILELCLLSAPLIIRSARSIETSPFCESCNRWIPVKSMHVRAFLDPYIVKSAALPPSLDDVLKARKTEHFNKHLDVALCKCQTCIGPNYITLWLKGSGMKPMRKALWRNVSLSDGEVEKVLAALHASPVRHA